MHRFSRMHLSPDVALRTLDTIDLEEKSRVAEGIALLAVVNERRDYLAAGYSCMRSYCMGRLQWTEDRALRRIQVARAALRLPELFEYLADGRLSVMTAAALVPHLTAANAAALLPAAAFRSRPEIIQLVAAHAQSSCKPGRSELAPTLLESSESHAPVHAISETDLAMATTCDVAHALVHANSSRRGRVSAAPSGGYDVRLVITEAEHADLTQAQALLGHAVPSGDPAELYARAMKHYLAHLRKQRLGVKPAATVTGGGGGRSIPKPLRLLVWERDGGRCAFVGTDGHRCEKTRGLEFDHITPLAMGGPTTAENLRLLCRAHNQYEAERVLGREHVLARRELAERARAHAKVAAKTDAARQSKHARAPMRDPAAQARYDDLHVALRGLGFHGAEASRGAALADDMPDASLEDRLRRALAELTRPVALRGERRARSTA